MHGQQKIKKTANSLYSKAHYSLKDLLLEVSEGECIPLQVSTCPYGRTSLKLPEFLDIRHMKMASLPALLTGRL